MPMSNATQITDAERAALGRWYEAGARALSASSGGGVLASPSVEFRSPREDACCIGRSRACGALSQPASRCSARPALDAQAVDPVATRQLHALFDDVVGSVDAALPRVGDLRRRQPLRRQALRRLARGRSRRLRARPARAGRGQGDRARSSGADRPGLARHLHLRARAAAAHGALRRLSPPVARIAGRLPEPAVRAAARQPGRRRSATPSRSWRALPRTRDGSIRSSPSCAKAWRSAGCRRARCSSASWRSSTGSSAPRPTAVRSSSPSRRLGSDIRRGGASGPAGAARNAASPTTSSRRCGGCAPSSPTNTCPRPPADGALAGYPDGAAVYAERSARATTTDLAPGADPRDRPARGRAPARRDGSGDEARSASRATSPPSCAT